MSGAAAAGNPATVERPTSYSVVNLTTLEIAHFAELDHAFACAARIQRHGYEIWFHVVLVERARRES